MYFGSFLNNHRYPRQSRHHLNSFGIMPTAWKRRHVASLVMTAAMVMLAGRGLTRTLTPTLTPTTFKHAVSNGRKGTATAAKLTNEIDPLITIVTFCTDEFGEALLSEFLGHKWQHPIIVYTNLKCHDYVERIMRLSHSKAAAIIWERYDIRLITSSVSNVTKMQSSVELIHHATSTNPFKSQRFLWSNIDVMLALMQDGAAGPLFRLHNILATYPNAVAYHRSRPLTRYSDSEDASLSSQPPQIMASQYACNIDTCRHLFTRLHEASAKDHLTTSSDPHTQGCLEEPDACVLLRSPHYDDDGTQISLWSLLSEASRAPAFWNELAVCTLIRDKNEYLPEWIEFHRLQGFDHFVIYDDASRNPSLFLDSYIEDGIVTLVDWSECNKNLIRSTEPHGFAPCQRAAFVDCQNRVASRWLGIFDVDEFIFAPAITNGTLLSALQAQSDDVAGIHFVGAVFGNGNRTHPEFPRNKSELVLITERYTTRQPIQDEEGPVGPSGAHFWAHKEIARLQCTSRNQHGIHSFIYDACPTAHVVEMHIADASSTMRMHHYQYLSEFQSHLKARMNGNPHVAIVDPVLNTAYNLIEDEVAASFSKRIRAALCARHLRGANGVIPRSVTLVLTSIGRIDLLNRTLDSFQHYNTYPITRAIIVDDSGQAGIVDFAHNMLEDFPLEIIYNPNLGDKRHHKTGMLGLIDCVDLAYSLVETEFIFHMEDDWEFLSPGFIERSIDILDADASIIQVWLRAHNDGHPRLPTPLETARKQDYYLMDPEFGEWHGFSFNPGLRRLHDYSILGSTFYEATKPHRQEIAGELDVNLLYYRMGYYGATTQKAEGFIRHIGWGRTTDPGCSQGCFLNEGQQKSK